VDDLPAELTLHVGERRRFRLPGLAQAGYRWKASVESGAEAVEVETNFDDAEPAATSPVGPFAAEALSIVARAPGRAKVRLAQSRSWETGTAAIAERRLAITVVDRAP
jgi:predicted secreted protein